MSYADVVRRTVENNIAKGYDNPWVRDGHVLTDEEAVKEYGLDNIMHFANSANVAHAYNGDYELRNWKPEHECNACAERKR